MMHAILPFFALSMTSSVAWADFPDDVALTHLDEYRGESVSNGEIQREAYETVVRQLAAGIANQPVAPADTLGLHGFDVSLVSTWAFISARGDDALHPDPWERVHQDEEPTRVMWRPGIQLRKGLPVSLEVGANWSWIAISRQTAIGGFGRWSVFEGWKDAPDFGFQIGYSGYIGNEELELGVLDGNMSIGYTFPFGYIKGVNQASVAPFGGIGFIKANAVPRLTNAEQAELSIGAVSGLKGKDHFKKGFSLFTSHIGVRLRSGDFTLTTAGSVTAKAVPTLSMTAGMSY
jgi:hypothetical protein